MLVGCSKGSSGKNELPRTEILVSVAASMTEVFIDIKDKFEKSHPNYSVKLNFASSGALQQQIEQGAPIDVFISAGKQQIERLKAKNLVQESQVIATNTLVIIISKNSKKVISNFEEVAQAGFERIALGNTETVPAGSYAKEALVNTNQWEVILPQVVYAKDVRQVVAYVESGNVDAGIVYKTDVLKAENIKVIAIPKQYYSQILYSAAVIHSSKQTDISQKFVQFLMTKDAQSALADHGFTVSQTSKAR